MASGIYIIHNAKNGKVYIGQAQNIQFRWKSHRRELEAGKHKNCHLQAAWNKYGAKSFAFKVLEYCSIEQLDEREQHFISVYVQKGICYNIAWKVKPTERGGRLSKVEWGVMSLEEMGLGKVLDALHKAGTVEKAATTLDVHLFSLMNFMTRYGLKS